MSFAAGKWFLLIAMFYGGGAFAQQTIKGVSFKSCSALVCTRLETAEVSRSNLNPSLMVFGDAKFLILDATGAKVTGLFEGGDGYFDLQAQVIVLRDLKHSRYHELIYDVNLKKVVYF